MWRPFLRPCLSDDCASASNDDHLFLVFIYCAFGVLIESEIVFPELVSVEGGVADVVIVRGNIAHLPFQVRDSGNWFGGQANVFQMDIDGVGRFLVSDGSRIVFDADESVGEEEIRLFLLGSVFGALLLQRGLLVLHGSSVVVDGRAVAFLGGSGVGKSTLSAAMVRRGLPLLADDLCVIDTRDGLVVQSGFPQSKLWLDSLSKFSENAGALRRVRPGLEKRALPVRKELFHGTSCPLERIFILSVSDNGELKSDRLIGPIKIAGLLACRYRASFAEAMGLVEREFQQIAKLALETNVDLIVRPSDPFDLDGLVSLVLS